MKNLKEMLFEGLEDEITIEKLYVNDVNLLCNLGSSKIYIKKYPAYVHQNNAFICVVVKGTDDSYILYTDGIYDILPKNIKEAVIAHELGHIENGYTDWLVSRYLHLAENGMPVINDRGVFEEISADLYACESVGAGSVLSLYNFFIEEKLYNEETIDELRERVSFIMARYGN